MAHGVVDHLADYLEAVASVKGRPVKAVGIEADLRTATAPSLALDDLEEPGAEATAAVLLTYPEVLDPTGPAPRPAIYPRDERAALVPHGGEDLARRTHRPPPC